MLKLTCFIIQTMFSPGEGELIGAKNLAVVYKTTKKVKNANLRTGTIS